MVLSEYQNGVCKEKKLDPEDVLCARLTISGSFTTVKIQDTFSTRISWFLVLMNRIKVEKSNPKYSSALKAFSEKHPFAKEWINMGTPDWHLKQMNISQWVWLSIWINLGKKLNFARLHWCWWHYNDDSFKTLGTLSFCWWFFNVRNRSAPSQSRQKISSPTSVTNMDVALWQESTRG